MPILPSVMPLGGQPTFLNQGQLMQQLTRRSPQLSPLPITSPFASPIPDSSKVSSVLNTPSIFDSLSDSAPQFETRDHKLQPNAIYDKAGPKQTNRWWQNLALNKGDKIIPLYPYLIQTTDVGLTLCYPNKKSTADYVISPFENNWDLQLQSSGNGLAKKVIKDDDLSVTVGWGQAMTSYLVRGSPYLTLDINNSGFKLKTIHAILKVEQLENKYLVTLNNGQTWAFYTLGGPVQWTQNSDQIEVNTPFTGILRIAIVKDVDNSLAMNQQILDKYSKTYPTGATVNTNFLSDSEANLEFIFETKGGSNEDLLLFSLPHHQDILQGAQFVDLKGYTCLKGNLKALVGSRWILKEQLSPITWNSPNTIDSSLIAKISQALEQDVLIEIDPKVTDVYFFGKRIAKLARLALIAESVNRNELIQPLLTKLKLYVEPWLRGRNRNKLIYDRTWGGLVTSDGLNNVEADFGNGWYNDHHFHYGYFLYTAAIIGKFDPNWVQNYKEPLLTMVRDFANPSDNDKYFPKLRFKDMFDGHSWASGLFEFNDGKNQESTSESVNGYYALHLLGLALNDQQLTNWGNLLVSTEIRSAKKYWHVDSSQIIYPVEFNHAKTVGVLWASKVDYATWFGKNVEFIHGIQMLPFTPISHSLLEKNWMKEAYEVVKTALTRQDPPLDGGWRSYIHMARAVNEPQQALLDFENSPKVMDDGNTLANTYYWLATQN